MSSRRSSAPLVALTAALFFVAAWPTSARAQQLGGAGESCQARSDCEEGLRCVENTCVAPEADAEAAEAGDSEAGEADPEVAEAEEAGEGAGSGETEAAGSSRWRDFNLGGTHFFAGLSFAPGLTGTWYGWGDLPIEAAFLFAIRLGVFFNTFELAAELTPATWVWYRNGESTASFTFNVTVGGLIRMADHAYWPMRFGLGMTARDMPYDSVWMHGRLDLIGFAYQFGHVIFELNLPSVRFHSEFHDAGIWSFLFNISFSYVV